MKTTNYSGHERFDAALAQYQKLSKQPFSRDLKPKLDKVRTEFLEVALERMEEESDPEATFWSCYLMLEEERGDRKKLTQKTEAALRANIKAGHIPSYWLLGSVLTGCWQGTPDEFIANRDGKRLIALAARKGYAPAMTNMLYYYSQQLTKSDYYAEKAYKTAQQLAAQDYPAGYLHLGECALHHDAPGPKGKKTAIEYFEKAYENLPNLDFVEHYLEGQVKFRLGVCYYEEGKIEKGLDLIHQAQGYESAATQWLEAHNIDSSSRHPQQDLFGDLAEDGEDDSFLEHIYGNPRDVMVIKLDKPFSFQREIDEAQEKKNNQEFSAEEIENILRPLNELTGLEEVKQQVRELVQYAQIMRRRKQAGLSTSALGMHMIFSGNPGTGKTTVARIVGKILHELGFLSTGNIIEVDRSGLVGEYIGETTQKTRQAANNARGGILFIDEAHALVHPSERDYGWEAIDTLAKIMEDRREDFVVIAAGYKSEISNFINANTGLASRFTWHIDFPDYKADDIAIIFEKMCNDADYQLAEEALEKLKAGITDIARREGRNFGNGRTARKLFEATLRHQAKRLIRDDVREKKALSEICAADIQFDYAVDDGTVTFLPKR